MHYWLHAFREALGESWEFVAQVDFGITLLGGLVIVIWKALPSTKWKLNPEHPVLSEAWRLLILFGGVFAISLFVIIPYRMFEDEHSKSEADHLSLVEAKKALIASQREKDNLADSNDQKQNTINRLEASRNDGVDSEAFQKYFENQQTMIKELSNSTNAPAESAVKDIAEKPLPPSFLRSVSPDSESAVADIKNWQIKNAASVALAADKAGKEATALASNIDPQFDVIVKSFLARLQLEADKYKDTVTSTYKGMPTSIPEQLLIVDSFKVQWKGDPNWTFKGELWRDGDEITLSIQTPNGGAGKWGIAHFSVDKSNLKQITISFDDGESQTLKIGQTDIQDPKAINAALSYLIGAQYIRLGISPPSSIPGKSASQP